MALETVKPKKYVSNFTVRLGPMVTVGSIYSIRKSKPKGKGGGSYKLVTPDGQEVRQVFIGKDEPIAGATVWEKEQLQSGIASEDAPITVVDKDAIKAAKVSEFPANVFNLTIHDATDVDTQTFHSDVAYLFQPDTNDPTNVDYHGMIRGVLATCPDRALMGMCNVKGHEALYRLVEWNNMLVLEKQNYPEELNIFPDTEPVVVAEVTASKLKNVVEKLSVPFDASEYRNTLAEKLADVDAGMAVVAPEAPKSTVDVDSVLDAFLAS